MRIVKEAIKWDSKGKRKIAMTNSFGFGGTNGSLVLANFE